MRHFPIFLDLAKKPVAVAGNGAVALAKLRLIAKTGAAIIVFAPRPEPELADWLHGAGVTHHARMPEPADLAGLALVYAAHDAPEADARLRSMARAAGVLVNVVDNLEASDFITPAIVDRAPLTVAIGSEGAAPVLARAIKADTEARLPQGLGVLARVGNAFRPRAEALPQGRRRRTFWSDYYFDTGPGVLEREGEAGLDAALDALLADHLAAEPKPGRVDLVGAGPGDPDLLTLRARKLLDAADVVIHDRLVPQAILELARREAVFVPVGKKGFGPSVAQEDINAAMVDHARAGAHVVRLKGGDPAILARLDEEIAALDAAGIDWAVTPGITAASAAAAAAGRSLTRRGRNGAVALLTAHDLAGFSEHDWRGLAAAGSVAAVYMGKRAARFVQGRLLMHGAGADLPVCLVENASRPNQRVIASTLATLATDLDGADLPGPVLMLLGIAPMRAERALAELPEAVTR